MRRQNLLLKVEMASTKEERKGRWICLEFVSLEMERFGVYKVVYGYGVVVQGG